MIKASQKKVFKQQEILSDLELDEMLKQEY